MKVNSDEIFPKFGNTLGNSDLEFLRFSTDFIKVSKQTIK